MALYLPGKEPENIRRQINLLFSKLDEAYPDKNVVGLHNEHKKWGETVTALYRQLGYPDGKAFLEAYGYTYSIKGGKVGRHKNVDVKAIIGELQKRYPNGSGFLTIDELFNANPDLGMHLKTLTNNASTELGMPLGKYLISIGLLKSKEKSNPKPVKEKTYEICKVMLPSLSDGVYYLVNFNYLAVGAYVEVEYGSRNTRLKGIIIEIGEYTEKQAPVDISKLKKLKKSLSERQYMTNLLQDTVFAFATIESEKIFEINDNCHSKLKDRKVISLGMCPWAVCRGLASDVILVLSQLVEKDSRTYELQDFIMADEGIFEIFVYGDDVSYVLEKFPSVKMAMFSENPENNTVKLCYSRSGYKFVTDSYDIGKCDCENINRWTLKHSPLDNFKEDGIKYEFKYCSDWKAVNYVLDDAGVIKEV